MNPTRISAYIQHNYAIFNTIGSGMNKGAVWLGSTIIIDYLKFCGK